MSIASELQNYADGLDDAYDAVSDMSGIIPQDKNINNLDAAIRTIPVGGATPNDGVLTITQNGVTVQTFSANQSTNATAALTDTTYSDFTGASSVAGAHGLVPAPAVGDDEKYLKGDGTWDYLNVVTEFRWGNGGIEKSGGESATDIDVSRGMRYGKAVIVDVTPGNNSVMGEFIAETSRGPVVTEFTVLEPGDGVGEATVVKFTYDGSNAVWAKDIIGLQSTLTAGSNITISSGTISATDTTYSDFTGATSSVAGAHGLVPAPATGDQGKVLHGDGTWKDATAKLVEMSYGESSAWAKFIAAYNAGSIVYCRASSNANPGTGAKTRKAFMAYVNNENTPTSVEFQYVRSASSKTDSNQCDQVFVYKLTNSNGGTWSVESRDMATKILVDSTLTKTYSSGANASMTLKAKAMTGATGSAAGTAGYVPAPAAGDQGKVLTGDGSWTNIFNLIYPVGSIYMSVNNTDPGTLFGGTWAAWGAGRVPVGVDTNDTDFDTVEETGGEKTHTLTVTEMPSHNHSTTGGWGEGSLGVDYFRTDLNNPSAQWNASGYEGGGQAHNNLQPYITCYMWKRTA